MLSVSCFCSDDGRSNCGDGIILFIYFLNQTVVMVVLMFIQPAKPVAKEKHSSSTSLKEIVGLYLAFFFTVRRSIRMTRVSFAGQFDTKQGLGMNPRGPAVPMDQQGLPKPV